MKLQKSTREVIASMLTENTGRHFLDSGGAYGRHWQRAEGMEVEHFDAAPRASIDRWGEVTLDVFHYLTERLEFLPEMQQHYEEFVKDRPDTYHLEDMEEFAEEFGDIEGCYLGGSFNTYNLEGEAISQTIQGIRFNYGGDTVALVQVHGGADVRGGYTAPRAFKVKSELFPYDCHEFHLDCPEERYHGMYYSGEWISYEGYALKGHEIPEWSEERQCLPCPRCGSPMEVEAPSVY